MHELYELKEMLCKELEELGGKGELTAGSLDTVDKLAHAIKNLDKIIWAKEDEEYSSRGGSYDGEMSGHYPMIDGSYRGGGYNRGGFYRGGGSYARGRGRNTRRDSMGRYSSEHGYSRAGREDMVEQLRDLMEDAPDDMSRKEIEKLISKMEQ